MNASKTIEMIPFGLMAVLTALAFISAVAPKTHLTGMITSADFSQQSFTIKSGESSMIFCAPTLRSNDDSIPVDRNLIQNVAFIIKEYAPTGGVNRWYVSPMERAINPAAPKGPYLQSMERGMLYEVTSYNRDLFLSCTDGLM